MAEHPLALSLAAKSKGSPGTTVASARPATADLERARRRNMARLYAELGALLPDLPPRAGDDVQANQARILEEAIAYVGALRGTVAELEAHSALAAGRAATGGGGAGVGVAEVFTSGEASCFAVQLPAERRPGSLTRVLEALHRHGAPVLAATVTGDGGEAAVTVTTAAVAPGVVDRIKADVSSFIA